MYYTLIKCVLKRVMTVVSVCVVIYYAFVMAAYITEALNNIFIHVHKRVPNKKCDIVLVVNRHLSPNETLL